jgi:RNA polymerase sigma-70 factor (ECF subfamily)
MDKNIFIKEVLPLREKLMNYARKFLKEENETEDVVQEVLIKLWCVRNEFYKYNSIYALSLQITKHLSLNRLNNQQRNQQRLDDMYYEPSENSTPYVHLENKDNIERVFRIIEQLPTLQQAILKMKHIEGLEVKEIAELTGSKPEAVLVNLSRARKRVKELFLKQQGQ